MAAIPTVAEEDARRPTRERETLIREQTRAVNRIRSTLIRFGIRTFKVKLRQASKHLEELRGPEDLAWRTSPVRVAVRIKNSSALAAGQSS